MITPKRIIVPRHVREQLRRPVTVKPEDEEELARCSPTQGPAGFLYFLENYGWIQDRKTRQVSRFIPFQGQRRALPFLVAGFWLVLLKGRQLGLTWLLAFYALWRITFSSMFTVTVCNQSKPYAQDFIWRVKFGYSRLPDFLRKRLTTDAMHILRWEAHDNFGEVRAVAGGPNAGRSMSGDLVVLDEASRIPYLAETMQALQPQIDVGEGQIVLLSSSAGPQGIFYETWVENYGEYGEAITPTGVGPSGFMPLFLHYSERPGRDAAWYARTKARMEKISPVAMKQEYPENPQEAWEYAAGRVYALFTRDQNVGDIEIPTTAARYRAIDWGQSQSAQVCLWIAHVPGRPGLLISPECPNTIREFFAYRWDPDDPQKVLKADDHTCDAVRYAVATFKLTGLVYVYRELYITNPVEQGWDPMQEIVAVHEMSGWEENEDTGKWQVSRTGEVYRGTVADRSWSKMIQLYTRHGITTIPHKKFVGTSVVPGKKDRAVDTAELEVKEGIRLVSNLIMGTIGLERWIDVQRMTIAAELAAEMRQRVARVNVPLERRALAIAVKQMRKRKV